MNVENQVKSIRTTAIRLEKVMYLLEEAADDQRRVGNDYLDSKFMRLRNMVAECVDVTKKLSEGITANVMEGAKESHEATRELIKSMMHTLPQSTPD